MSSTPTSYKDPFYARLASAVESKLDLPAGLLNAVITRGERSNADQVSEAGARTVAQIIPATRDAALKKYGIDAYLSPENALEVAGRLLKEGLQRNGGDASAAVAEYHGGTDRKNWGLRTRAYVQRVVEQQQESSTPAAEAGAMAKVYDAYRAGRMTPEEEAEFEQAVSAGNVRLPLGQSLKRRAAPGPMVVPQSVVDAYSGGAMTEAERQEFEQALETGEVALPPGVALPAAPEQKGLFGRIREQFTGEGRRTQQTEALPDYTELPEFGEISAPALKTALGTLLASTPEAVQIIQANFPGVQVRQDERGNYFLRSGVNGKEYAVKPGFRVGDLPRAAGAVAAFTPAGRAATLPGMAAAGAGTQAVIEATQAATGGEFNPAEVAIAGALPPVVGVAAQGVRAGAGAIRQLVQRGRPATPGAATVPEVPAAGGPAAVAPPPVAPAPTAPPAAPMDTQQMAQTAKKAAQGGLGSTSAKQALAEQAMPDAQVVAAARRLGIENHLQPDHVTTNQAYRELAQAVKSIPTSKARSVELQGLEQVGKRASDLIDEMGGINDLSALSGSVKTRMQATQQQLDQQADELYKQIRQSVPAQADAPAPSVLTFIRQRAKDLGGEANLSGPEKMILRKLSPRQGGPAQAARAELGEVVTPSQLRAAAESESRAGLAFGQGAPAKVERSVKQPTYALLDDVRRDLTAARIKRQGPFKDADTGLIKKLEAELMKDQRAALEPYGMLPTFDAARQVVAVRKGLEDDLAALFGKNLDGTFVGTGGNGLPGAVRALAQGDSAKLVRLIQTVPQDMRQEVIASGLASAFRKASTRGEISFGEYAKWYEGLMRNRQAYAALMTNLPLSARKQLHALYKVSDGISKASRERITNGRIQAVEKYLQDADTLVSRLYGAAQRNVASAAAGTAVGTVAGPGAGAAVASALARGPKPPAAQAIDELIVSPEFAQLVKAPPGAAQSAAARSLAATRQFRRFIREIGNPPEMTNKERWILQSMQARNTTTERQ